MLSSLTLQMPMKVASRATVTATVMFRRDAASRAASFAFSMVSIGSSSMPSGAGKFTHHLAQAHRTLRRPVRVEANRVRLEQHDDGGAEQEAAHLFALLQRDVLVEVGPL